MEVTFKRVEYPCFEANGKSYGSILTERQVGHLSFAKDSFMKLTPQNPQLVVLWLSRQLTTGDLMTIAGYPSNTWDTDLPQPWFDAHLEEIRATPHVWLYDGDHKYFGRPFKPFEEIYPMVIEMVYDQWLTQVESLIWEG